MAMTTLNGPVIAGLPNGYPRHWTRQQYRSTVARKRPADLLRNPTTYDAWRKQVSTEADYVNSKELTPYYGAVALNWTSHGIPSIMKQLRTHSDARVLSKIKNEKWNMGIFLGELPKTQKFLMGVIPRIVNIYRAMARRAKDPKYWRSLVKRGKRFLKRRKARGFNRKTGDLAGLWLEFRYAVSPLAYDAQDMLNYLYDSATNMPIFRAASGASDTVNVLYKNVNGPSTAVSSQLQCRTVVYYSAVAEANALKRLGLINLPAILWELTPLSFVVDMVLPVGTFIGNFDALVGVTVLSSTRSETIAISEARPTYRSTPTGRVYGGSAGSGRQYTRTVIGAPINKPGFTKSPTGQQLCDLVALMRNIVLK